MTRYLIAIAARRVLKAHEHGESISPLSLEWAKKALKTLSETQTSGDVYAGSQMQEKRLKTPILWEVPK